MNRRRRTMLWTGSAILLHAVLYVILMLLFAAPLPPISSFWYLLAVPYADSGLLGMWLAAGQSKAWLRFSVTLVGVSVLTALCVTALERVHVLVIGPSLVATTALAALGTLGLGCLGSLAPQAARWRLRFALWEIVVSICIIGVAMAILRTVIENAWINFNQWSSDAGGHFLTFAAVSGAFLAASGIPFLLAGRWLRWIGAGGVLMLLGVTPFVGAGLFSLLGLSGGDLDLFYPAHAGQLAVAWLTLFLLDFGLGGLFRVPESGTPEPSPASSVRLPPSANTAEDDFFHMQ